MRSLQKENSMRMKLAVSVGITCFLLATIAPAYAQQHAPNQEKAQEQQAKPERQKPRPNAAKPAQPPREPQRSYGGTYHGTVQHNGPTIGGVHQSGVPQNQVQVRSGFVQSRAASWNNDHRTWQQRGGYNGYRIPQDRFRQYFGKGSLLPYFSLAVAFRGRLSALPVRRVLGHVC